jgi:alkylhydroperoxidase/carboxymuconolactone decarboxylase family protein YurZ
MDEKTSVLICLGAATAANCVPCFEHYLKKAKGLNLSSEEILEAADLASKVKNGAHLVMRSGIKTFMGIEKASDPCACGPGKGTCCG